MIKFYSISHDSFRSKKIPWIEKITKGLIDGGTCPECGARLIEPSGELKVTLEKNNKASVWPDAMGCGHYPLLIISSKVLELWEMEHMGRLHAAKVEIEGEIPIKMQGIERKDYYWLIGQKMQGAKIDFEKSGFVDVTFCKKCGTRDADINATYDKQHSGTWPLHVIEETWNGDNLFTTDLSPQVFICTDDVFKFAGKHELTNFEFIPTEVAASELEGIPYLKKKG